MAEVAEDWESHKVEERRLPPRFGLGMHVELQTTGDQQLQGTVFAAAGQCVVLQQPGSSPYHSNVLLFKDSIVAALSHITLPAQPVDTRLPVVDPRRGAERLRRAVAAAEAEAAKIGEGVSAEAQAVFDALSKTLPCRWDGKHIVVLEEVRPVALSQAGVLGAPTVLSHGRLHLVLVCR